MTTTLAYDDTATNTAIKSFRVQLFLRYLQNKLLRLSSASVLQASLMVTSREKRLFCRQKTVKSTKNEKKLGSEKKE